MKNILYWFPRILMITFILFISFFAFDFFDGEKSFPAKPATFLIHLIPSVLLIVLLVLSWRRELIGGISFFLLGIIYILIAWGKFSVYTYLIILGPMFIAAILFIINWVNKKMPDLIVHFKIQKKGDSTGLL